MQVRSKIPALLQYVREKFLADLNGALALARTVLSGDLSLNALDITSRDVKPGEQRNGGTDFDSETRQTIRVLSSPVDTGDDVEYFRSTLFHEFGHFIRNLFLVQQAAPSYLDFRANQVLFRNSEKDFSPEGMQAAGLALDLAALYKGIETPFSELIADVFRVLLLRRPGYASRDFSTMNADPTGFDTDSEHQIYNPFRAHLWQTYLSGRLGEPGLAARILTALMRVSVQLVEEQYFPGKAQISQKGIHASQVDRPSTETLNRTLIQRFDTAMSSGLD
jgi:hypothetical protein